MRTSLILLSLCSAGLLCSCATAPHIDWISAGPQFAPKTPQQVKVYRSRKEITRPWEVIGLVRGKDVPALDTYSLAKQLELAREKAAAYGADAILVRETLSGESPGMGPMQTQPQPTAHIAAQAILFTDTLTPDEKKSLENWTQQYSGWP